VIFVVVDVLVDIDGDGIGDIDVGYVGYD